MGFEIYRFDEYQRLRAGLRPDPRRLTEELIEISQQITDCGDYLGEAHALKDDAEMEHRAQIVIAAMEMRGGDGKKPPEAQIKEEAPLAPDAMTAYAKLKDAQASVRYWTSLMQGIQMKASALKRMSELTVSGYLAAGQTSAYDRSRADMADARRAYTPATEPPHHEEKAPPRRRM